VRIWAIPRSGRAATSVPTSTPAFSRRCAAE
jgi:hypothetical protein